MTSSNQRTIHVAFIGETGAGKSSIVNLLTGKEIAQVNNDREPCTIKAAAEYKVVKADTIYHIWDTRGLNLGKEPGKVSFARMGQKLGFIHNAESELKKLLHDQTPDLVLLCIDARKISISDHWSMYGDIFASLRKRMKVAVVVTRLEDLQGSAWKERYEAMARGVFWEFPGASMIEGVPKFEELDDQDLKDCRDRILTLISKSC